MRYLVALVCVALLSGCSGAAQPTRDSTGQGTPISLDSHGTRTVDQEYLDDVVKIGDACTPYYDKIAKLITGTSAGDSDAAAKVTEVRTALGSLATEAAKFRKVGVPPKFLKAHAFLIGYSDEINSAVSAFDKGDIPSVTSAIGRANTQMINFGKALKDLKT